MSGQRVLLTLAMTSQIPFVGSKRSFGLIRITRRSCQNGFVDCAFGCDTISVFCFAFFFEMMQTGVVGNLSWFCWNCSVCACFLTLLIHLKAYAWQPGAGRRGALLALRSPRFDRSRRHVGPMFALCSLMLAVCCPGSALCELYVGPKFAYVSREKRGLWIPFARNRFGGTKTKRPSVASSDLTTSYFQNRNVLHLLC